MLGTLTIHGPLDTLSKIAVDLDVQYPKGIAASAAPTSYMGWDVNGAKALLAEVTPKAYTAIDTVVDGAGFGDDGVLRSEIGDSLRGSVTGPITRQIQKLQKRRILPDGVPNPLSPDYDPNITGRQRTKGLHMDPELVPIFREALGK